VLTLAMEFYRRIGIDQTELRINSVGCPLCRPQYREALLAYARPRLGQMSDDNRRRFAENPLRMLDSKEACDKEALADAPRLIDFLCEDCRRHFDTLRGYLDDLAVVYTLDPNLVRGFDYYTKTAFEVISPQLGAMNVIGGGGRYDGLVEELGGPATPGIGFGIGTERCLLALEQLGKTLPLDDERPVAMIAPLGEAARPIAVRLLHQLRTGGVAADMDYAGRSLKAQMRAADRLHAECVVMLGDNEIAAGVATVKEMATGDQQAVPFSDLVAHLSARAQAR
jgi:histidyl-tRNA synthetase